MEQKECSFTVDKAGSRLDVALTKNIDGLSRAQARKACEEGKVYVNDVLAKKFGQIVNKGDVVKASLFVGFASARAELGKSLLPLDIVFEDRILLVLNKPRQIHSVTQSADDPATLADAVVAYCPSCLESSSDRREAGLVQRLDYYTSGIILAAKTKEAWKALHKAFTTQAVKKSYLALVQGNVPGDLQTITTSFLDVGEKVKVLTGSQLEHKGSTTSFKKLSTFQNKQKEFSVVHVVAQGGHRHQVRAHLSYAGYPLCGDGLYGATSEVSDLAIEGLLGIKEGFLLHAESVQLDHPESRESILLKAFSPEFDLLL